MVACAMPEPSLARSIAPAALAAFVVMLGFGVLFPVLADFTEHLGLSKLQFGVIMATYPAVGVLASPWWGSFSDRRGRRPAIVLGLVGLGASFIWFGMGSSFAELVAARVAGGLLSAAALPAAFAYAADVSPPNQRSAAMGMLGGAVGLGVALGPFLGGSLLALGLRVPYFASGAIALGGALIVAALMPESLTPSVREAQAQRRAWLAQTGLSRARIARVLLPYLAASFLLTAARLSVDVTLRFLVGDRLGSGAFSAGLLMLGMGFVIFAVQGGAIRPLVRRRGEYAPFVWGSALMAGGLLAAAWVRTWPGVIAAGLAIAVGFALHTPTLTALLSHAAEGVHGEAQGLNSAVQALARVVGPPVFAVLYDEAQWTAYALGAALALLAIGVARGRVTDGRRVIEGAAAPVSG
jgi:MFS family permease